MARYEIHGGAALNGSVTISGAKNAVVAILPAALLVNGPCRIENVPDISDVRILLDILRGMGATIEKPEDGVVIIDCSGVTETKPNEELVCKMRASYYLMGALLGRFGHAHVALPGGCNFASRPIDQHLKGFRGLGAEVEETEEYVNLKPAEGGLHGNRISLDVVSVGATANIMMAAVLAKGTTVIESAAREPEVVDLANFLNKMGARIEGAGSRTITIHGVEKLHGCDHTVIPDRIEAGTFMVAAAMVSDGLMINRVYRPHMKAISDLLIECGHRVEYNEDGTSVFVAPGESPRSGKILTNPYPEYPTDMQAQMTALFALTPGISVVKDTIFPQRFMHCSELKRMGANIKVDSGTAIITGVSGLSGAPVMASDLRASAALVLAALAAEGTTEIHRLYHIDRGYEMLDEKLMMLGARVRRVRDEEHSAFGEDN